MYVKRAYWAIACTFALSAAAIPASSTAADPIEINVIFSLSGASAFIGRETARSVGVVADTINRAGGVDGRPIKFTIQDDQSNPQVAVQIANNLLAKNAPIIIGPSAVAQCAAVAPLIAGKAVMFCMSAAFHSKAHSYAYSAGVSTTEQTVFAVRYLRERGLKKLASITSADSNGVDTDRGLAEALRLPENKSVTLVAAEHFRPSDITIDAQMSKIKASGAQALITGNNGTPLGTILHAYTNLGVDVPFITTPGALNAATVTQYAAMLPKEFLITGVLGDGPAVIPNGPEKATYRIYYNAFKAAGIEPDHGYSLSWDPAMIVVSALRKVGPNGSAAQINRYIENLHGWSGVAGEYDFRNGNQSGLDANSVVMVRWIADRKEWTAVTRPGGTAIDGRKPSKTVQ
jgi:branched-chain amino acid transport system substrate-binding protein